MFYDIFIDLCAEKGKRPSDVSRELGIGKSTISMWKKQKSIPNAVTLMQLAEYFNVTPAYLAGNKLAKRPLHFKVESEQKEKASSLNKKKPEDITFDDFSYALLDESKELTEENKDKLLEMAKFFKMQQDKEKKSED